LEWLVAGFWCKRSFGLGVWSLGVGVGSLGIGVWGLELLVAGFWCKRSFGLGVWGQGCAEGEHELVKVGALLLHEVSFYVGGRPVLAEELLIEFRYAGRCRFDLVEDLDVIHTWDELQSMKKTCVY
jgi:hypothetical protein